MIPKYKPGDKVRLLDGGEIEDFTAGWTNAMNQWAGTVCTIEEKDDHWSADGRNAYSLVECVWTWDERAMELVKESEKEA